MGVVKIVVLVQVKHDVIKTCFRNLHLRSAFANLKFALEDSGSGVVLIDAGSCFGSELCQSSAVKGLLTGVNPNQGEILAALQNDIFLEHTVTSSLAVSLVDTVCHNQQRINFVKASSFAEDVNTVLDQIIYIDGFVGLFAGCHSKSGYDSANCIKDSFHFNDN